jgi:excisionase family DNA binding protein
MAEPEAPELLTAAEVAKLFRVSKMSVWRWTQDGKFPPGAAIQLPGTMYRYRRDAIMALLNGDAS